MERREQPSRPASKKPGLEQASSSVVKIARRKGSTTWPARPARESLTARAPGHGPPDPPRSHRGNLGTETRVWPAY